MTRIALTLLAACGFLFQELPPTTAKAIPCKCGEQCMCRDCKCNDLLALQDLPRESMPALWDEPVSASPPVRQSLPDLWDTEPVIRQSLPGLFDEIADRPGRDNRTDPTPPKDDRPVVYLWTQARNCAPCQRLEGDRKAGLDQRFKFLDGSKVYPRHKVPASRPYLLWPVGERWYSQSGYSGRAALEKTIEGTFKPAPQQAKRDTSAKAQGYPIHSPIRWTGYTGWQHLAGGEHAGKFDPSWLRSLSWQQAASLHDDDHEGRVKWAYVVRPSRQVATTAGE